MKVLLFITIVLYVWAATGSTDYSELGNNWTGICATGVK
jgi:carbonic anhydrase